MVELRSRHLCTYRAILDAPQLDIGTAQFGRRLIASVLGGEVEGERLNGRVLPGGGDWALIDTARDTLRLDARIAFESHDGAKIFVAYRGVLAPLSEVTRKEGPGPSLYFRTQPVFETGDARYAWLNNVVAVGLGRLAPQGVAYDVFEIL